MPPRTSLGNWEFGQEFGNSDGNLGIWTGENSYSNSQITVGIGNLNCGASRPVELAHPAPQCAEHGRDRCHRVWQRVMRNNLGEEIRGLPNELRDELRLVTADEAGEMRFVLQEACEEARHNADAGVGVDRKQRLDQ